MSTRSRQYNINPISVPPSKLTDTVMDIHEGQTSENKSGYMDEDGFGSVVLWNILLVVSLESVVFRFIT